MEKLYSKRIYKVFGNVLNEFHCKEFSFNSKQTYMYFFNSFYLNIKFFVLLFSATYKNCIIFESYFQILALGIINIRKQT
jgi:hypothetical protein